MKNAKNILDKEIRPYLNSHNGDIEIISLEDGVLTVKLLGACASCLSADVTLEHFVKDKLMDPPRINDVVLFSGVSQELLDFAKKILDK